MKSFSLSCLTRKCEKCTFGHMHPVQTDQPFHPFSLISLFKALWIAKGPTLHQADSQDAECIATDKRGYSHDIFLISEKKTTTYVVGTH